MAHSLFLLDSSALDDAPVQSPRHRRFRTYTSVPQTLWPCSKPKQLFLFQPCPLFPAPPTPPLFAILADGRLSAELHVPERWQAARAVIHQLYHLHTVHIQTLRSPPTVPVSLFFSSLPSTVVKSHVWHFHWFPFKSKRLMLWEWYWSKANLIVFFPCSKPLGGFRASGSVSQSMAFIHGCVWMILRIRRGTSYIPILIYAEKI